MEFVVLSIEEMDPEMDIMKAADLFLKWDESHEEPLV
jgi:hypothetical protein